MTDRESLTNDLYDILIAQNALSRVTYEFKRHDPVKPKGSAGLPVCGYCSMMVRDIDNYCPNCGREIKRDDDNRND